MNQTLLLNFHQAIDDGFYLRMNKQMKNKFLKLMRLKKTLDPSNFIFLVKVTDVEFEETEESKKSYHYEHVFLFSPDRAQITIDSKVYYNYLPLHVLKIGHQASHDLIKSLSETDHISKANKQIRNLLHTLLKKIS